MNNFIELILDVKDPKNYISVIKIKKIIVNINKIHMIYKKRNVVYIDGIGFIGITNYSMNKLLERIG